jgi:hypothetical protein
MTTGAVTAKVNVIVSPRYDRHRRRPFHCRDRRDLSAAGVFFTRTGFHFARKRYSIRVQI